MSQPQALPLTLSVKHEGRTIALTLTRCKVFMAGEFAGNVDLYLDCDPSFESIVQESLQLRVPGEDRCVEFIASGGPDDGVMLIFNAEAIALLADAPESLSFYWCGELMASVSPELSESAPISEVGSLIDPLEILPRPAIQTSNPICLGTERDWIWLLPAVILIGFGVGGCFGNLGFAPSQIPYVRFASFLMLLLGIAIAAMTRFMPKRQVWFDRNRREILLVEGRTFSVEKSLVDATPRSVEGFAHVRLCKREYAPEISDDTNTPRVEFLISLEGPIPFGFDEGRVHTRSDALHLATFSGERAARRFAAEAGYHLGLRILIASDW